MSSKKALMLVMALVAIAALVAACGGGGGSSGGGGQDVTITATDFKFDPNTITATAGQTVNVTIVNKGSTTHDFTLKETNTKISADAGQTAKGSFTAPAAGTYQFICDVPGHADQGMVGTLTVK